MCRCLAIALGLALLAACEEDEQPFEDIRWSAQCSSMPRVFEVGFPAAERVDEAGRTRTYLGRVEIVLDGTGLQDVYPWQLTVSDLGDAETDWMERAPIPADLADAWGLRELTIEAGTFQDFGDSAEVTGTCTWDGAPGDFGMNMVDDCDACFDCSTARSPRGAGPAALLIAAAVLARRRRPAAW